VLKDKNVLSRGTFSEVLNLLPADKFVRVHRSFVVAVNKINKPGRDEVVIGKKSIPVSEA